MRRKLFTAMSVVSLLLFVATIVIWVRSEWVADYFSWTNGYGDWLGNDFDEVVVGIRGGGVYVYKHLHIQGTGPFSGGAYNIPTGRRFSWVRDERDVRYPSSERLWLPQYAGLTWTRRQFAGFECWLSDVKHNFGFHDHSLFVLLPIPFIAAGMAIAPGLWLFSALKRRGAARLIGDRKCLTCAYDLTGNTSGVCPECGTAVAPVGA